jgi:hypothetical protein
MWHIHFTNWSFNWRRLNAAGNLKYLSDCSSSDHFQTLQLTSWFCNCIPMNSFSLWLRHWIVSCSNYVAESFNKFLSILGILFLHTCYRKMLVRLLNGFIVNHRIDKSFTSFCLITGRDVPHFSQNKSGNIHLIKNPTFLGYAWQFNISYSST